METNIVTDRCEESSVMKQGSSKHVKDKDKTIVENAGQHIKAQGLRQAC